MTKRGRAGVQAFLFDAAGKYIESPYNLETLDAQLGPGSVPVRIYFNGQNIRKHGADGPYTIQLIILTDPSVSMLEVDSMRNAHTTAAYRHTQFEDSPLVLGAGSDALVDANKDGIAEALVITLSVAGANPGIYRWSADLMTITGTHVAAIFGQSALDAGTVTLRFDGTQIRG